jgi:hypothetical protein
MLNAKGALSLRAWGNALGFVKLKEAISAESAIHFRGKFDENDPGGLTRAFSALVSGKSHPWGDAPG